MSHRKTAAHSDDELAAYYNAGLARGVARTVREMAAFAGYTSTATGHKILSRLESAGLIPGRRRRVRTS